MGGIVGKDVLFVLKSEDPIDEDLNCGKGPLGKGIANYFARRLTLTSWSVVSFQGTSLYVPFL